MNPPPQTDFRQLSVVDSHTEAACYMLVLNLEGDFSNLDENAGIKILPAAYKKPTLQV